MIRNLIPKKKVTRSVLAHPSIQEGVTLIIPAGDLVDIMTGAPAPSGYVRVRWDGYADGAISLYVMETDIESSTVAV